MSTTPRPPLLSDEDVQRIAIHKALEICEAARSKDAELIQELVDGLAMLKYVFASEAGYQTRWGDDALDAASAAGFKPTEP